MEQAFVFAFSAVLEDREYFIEKWNEMMAGEDVLKREKAMRLLTLIERMEPIREFDALFYGVAEKMTVFEGQRVVVMLIDGSEVECGV